MKLVIKERKSILKEDVSRPGTYEMRCEDYVKLTTDAKLRAQIQKSVDRPDYFGEPFDTSKIGRPYLLIDKSGQVTGHEGRHRATALLKHSGPDARMNVDIAAHADVDIRLESLKALVGQYDKTISIPVNDQNFKWIDPSVDNILNIPSPPYGTSWEGPDAYEKAQIFIGNKLNDSGMDIQEFCDLVYRSYHISDDTGRRLAAYPGEVSDIDLLDPEGYEPEGNIYLKVRSKR